MGMNKLSKAMLAGTVGASLVLTAPAVAQDSGAAQTPQQILTQQKELLTLQRDIATLKGELAEQKFGFLKELQLPKSEVKLGDGQMESVALAGGAAREVAKIVATETGKDGAVLLVAPGERLALDLGGLMAGRISYMREALSKVLKEQCLLNDPIKDKLDPKVLKAAYPDPQPRAERESLTKAAPQPLGPVISGVASLLSKVFSVEVNVKDVAISTDAGFLWAEVAKAMHGKTKSPLITPSLALGLPPETNGKLHQSVFGSSDDSLHSLYGKATACQTVLKSGKSAKAKAAAETVTAVIDATDTFVKAVGNPGENGVVPLLEADRQFTLAETVRTAKVLRLTIHQAGGAQMTRRSLFGTRAAVTGALLVSYTLALPANGTIAKAGTFVCGATIPAGKRMIEPTEVTVACK